RPISHTHTVPKHSTTSNCKRGWPVLNPLFSASEYTGEIKQQTDPYTQTHTHIHTHSHTHTHRHSNTDTHTHTQTHTHTHIQMLAETQSPSDVQAAGPHQLQGGIRLNKHI